MGKLTLVGTSIGNVEDISIRAIKAILESEVILAEDTRVIKKLQLILKQRYLETLNTLGVKFSEQKVLSYREQNHEQVLPQILLELEQESNIILTTDAGMPSISDPGYKLVKTVIELGHQVDVIPGPTAVSSALAVSGLPTDKFTFIGFLPRKRKKIIDTIDPYINLSNTLVIYESPYRVKKTLEIVREKYGNILQIAAVKDLTKKFQQVYRGDVDEVIKHLPEQLKGEWVLVISRIE